jgi:hypothetical protein
VCLGYLAADEGPASDDFAQKYNFKVKYSHHIYNVLRKYPILTSVAELVTAIHIFHVALF